MRHELYAHMHPERQPRTLVRTTLIAGILGQHELIQGLVVTSMWDVVVSKDSG